MCRTSGKYGIATDPWNHGSIGAIKTCKPSGKSVGCQENVWIIRNACEPLVKSVDYQKKAWNIKKNVKYHIRKTCELSGKRWSVLDSISACQEMF